MSQHGPSHNKADHGKHNDPRTTYPPDITHALREINQILRTALSNLQRAKRPRGVKREREEGVGEAFGWTQQPPVRVVVANKGDWAYGRVTEVTKGAVSAKPPKTPDQQVIGELECPGAPRKGGDFFGA